MNKLKVYLLVLLSVLIFVSCDSSEKVFSIRGELIGMNSSNLLIAKVEGSKVEFIDTVKVDGGKFDFEMEALSENDFIFLVPSFNKKKFIKIWGDNSNLQIIGNIDSLTQVSVTGSDNHKLFENLMKDYGLIEKQSEILQMEMQLAAMDGEIEESDALEEQMYANESRKTSLFIGFAKEYPDNCLSAWALNQVVSYSDYKTLSTVYNAFTPGVKSSKYSLVLKMLIDEMEKTAIGADIPNFSLPDINGVYVEFESFKGKYALLEFWSPLCFYCRQENPFIVGLYNKYNKEEFVIVGVNVDEDRDFEMWKLVVEEDGLDFLQLVDTIGVADYLKVDNTPYNILLDKDGRILARDLRGELLESKLDSILIMANE